MITASIPSSKFVYTPPLHSNSISSLSNLLLVLSPPILSFQLYPYNNRFRLRRYAAVRTTSSGGSRGWGSDSYGAELLRKPVISPAIASEEGEESDDKNKNGGGGEWVDWEDQILQETVPLVNFVRMILHSGMYESGDRLSPEHERTILNRVLPYHPECEKKIGTGVDYVTIGYHPDFDRSRCLFIVRKDGELVDFSYWKCIKGLIRKNYPLYADTFIIRHFKKPRRVD